VLLTSLCALNAMNLYSPTISVPIVVLIREKRSSRWRKRNKSLRMPSREQVR